MQLLMMLCSAYEVPLCGCGGEARLVCCGWSVVAGQCGLLRPPVARQYAACLFIEHARCMPCGLCDVPPVIVCVCPGLWSSGAW